MGEKYNFRGENFADCSLCCVKECHVPNFVEKTFANSHKIMKFAKVFSLESFPLYGKTTFTPSLVPKPSIT